MGFTNKVDRNKKKPNRKKILLGFSMAEKEGFEPSIPFWGIHDFQSCALGQLRDFSINRPAPADLGMIHHRVRFVKHNFCMKKIFLKFCRNMMHYQIICDILFLPEMTRREMGEVSCDHCGDSCGRDR